MATKRKRLTMKTARELAKRELGTAKTITAEPGVLNSYRMTIGNLVVRIHLAQSGHIVMTASWASGMQKTVQLFDLETLEKDFEAEEIRYTGEQRARFEEWVEGYGVDSCCQKVKEAWHNVTGE